MSKTRRGGAMPQLTEEQKREALLILSIGCDRNTAAQYVGADTAAMTETIRTDLAFADALVRAEAAAEMAHMRNIQQAAKEDKNWRASVWWLERRSPDRYGKHNPEAISPAQLKKFLLALADAIAEEVCSEEDRARLLMRLQQMGGPIAVEDSNSLDGGRLDDSSTDDNTDDETRGADASSR